MPRQSYETRLENFITSNAELVGEYESLDLALPIEYCTEDIIEWGQKLMKADKTKDALKAIGSLLKKKN